MEYFIPLEITDDINQENLPQGKFISEKGNIIYEYVSPSMIKVTTYNKKFTKSKF